MDCSGFDWKGYSLDELTSEQAAEHARHLQECAHCRAEAAAFERTAAALRALPQMEPPRRIVFVADAVPAQSWWRRMGTAGPQWGLAAAGIVALAIVAHGYLAATPAGLQAQLASERQAREQLEKRMEAVVDARLNARIEGQLRDALVRFDRQLAERDRVNAVKLEQRVDAQRDSDRKAVSYAYERLERRLNYALLSARSEGGN